jgi:hypothetical protein
MAYAIKITYQKTKVSILVKFLFEISLAVILYFVKR